MKNILSILVLSFALVACHGEAGAPVDADSDDAATLADGDTVDAFVSDVVDGGDAAFLDAMVDAFADDDASLDVDAVVDAAAPDVTLEEACARVRAVYDATMCGADFFHCAFVASSVPEARVVACIDDVEFGYSEVSGPPDRTSRCNRAIAALSGCHE